MRVASSGTRAYPYEITNPADCYPVTIQAFKDSLRKPNSKEDEFLSLIIAAATAYAENVTGLALISRTVETTRDFIPLGESEGYYLDGCMPFSAGDVGFNVGYELRRTPVQSVTSIKYLEANTIDSYVTINPDNYYLAKSQAGNFSSVLSRTSEAWIDVQLIKPVLNAIIITFIAGYGNNHQSVPADLRMAILQHAMQIYFNRGDCSDCGCADSLPPNARSTYANYKVRNL